MNEIDLLQRYESGELIEKAKKFGLTIGIEKTQSRDTDVFLHDVEIPNINDLYSVDCAGYCSRCGKLCFNVAPQWDGDIVRYVQSCGECYEFIAIFPARNAAAALGAITSEAKKKSSAANGRKGGRPRKAQPTPGAADGGESPAKPADTIE